jgi:hypothetical protein
MKYIQFFTVQGKASTFPFDMLRYDGCYPTDSDAVEALTYTRADAMVRDENGKMKFPVVSARMARYVDRKDIPPTFARWASFGWTVLPNVETRKV